MSDSLRPERPKVYEAFQGLQQPAEAVQLIEVVTTFYSRLSRTLSDTLLELPTEWFSCYSTAL